MKKEKLEFEYDLGIDLDKLNVDVNLVEDFNKKFMELCLVKLQKRKQEKLAGDTLPKESELKGHATLSQDEQHDLANPETLSQNNEESDKILDSTDKKKKKKKKNKKKKK
ncbi:hypothetical protein [Halalkalibacter flavus]|uniref:hypothetical protein n=1 Tax=Halalkalibacter flavus TaxID=3090668 RepID=UPI002FCBF8CB